MGQINIVVAWFFKTTVCPGQHAEYVAAQKSFHLKVIAWIYRQWTNCTTYPDH